MKGYFCDNCKLELEKEYWYRKNCLDEHFCNPLCLERFVLENLEVRKGEIEVIE